MKNKLYALLSVFILFVTGCADFTEITPKGKNILNTVKDLNLLLNYTYSADMSGVNYFINDFYPYSTNIPRLLKETSKTSTYAYFAWDESVDRVGLAESDGKYTSLYGIIGKVANPVLQNIDAAQGDPDVAHRLKAEALVLRAHCHYLLVNLYAKAYNPATAATDPGIVYSKETDPIGTPNEKLSVARIYELILADLDAAIALKSLPALPAKMRVGLPFAYAVKAKVLMSMRDYTGAYAAAGESLKLNGNIDDYNQFLAEETMFNSGIEFTRPKLACTEQLFETPAQLSILSAFSPEMWDTFEDEHIIKKYMSTDEKIFGFLLMGKSRYGLDIPCLYAFNAYYSSIGLTTIDMYLTQAECKIREGETGDAMELLNKIRKNRIATDAYTPREAATASEAFTWLKRISRSENFATIQNYINLKRWNTEEAYKTTLTKTVDGQVFTLAPDSPLWIYPFPQNATNFNTNLTQNYK